MEQKFKEIIRKKLPQLVEMTTCSAKFLAIFLSKSIFSRNDVELIVAEERREGQLAASKKFYDFLLGRTGSFKVLLEALNETSQTGAANILKFSPDEENENASNHSPKFCSKSLKYITDYVNQPDAKYLIVSSDDCKITCDWILESTPHCKLYSLKEILGLYKPPEKDAVLLTNLEEDLSPIFIIEQNTNLKVVFVTTLKVEQVNDKLPNPKSWKVVQDSMRWSDLSSLTKYEITSSLKQTLGLNDEQLANTLSSMEHRSLIELINKKFPVPENLFFDTIPPLISHYVTRTLQSRYVIENTIFKDELYNEFVLFTGIERFRLSDFCGQKLTESSGNLLRHKKPISHFIILENEIDFEMITESFPQYAIHLLEYRASEFILRKSRGNMSNIQKFVAEKQHSLVESEFVSRILEHRNSHPVCISDTPGKGKSVLLAKLATEVKNHHKTGIVVFITLKDLINFLKERQPISSSLIVDSVSQFCSTSALGQAYLNANKHYIRELMFDGFDEIDADDIKFAFDCLNQIRSVFCETRVWITSRPHMLPELERCMETLGFNIAPFSKSDQMLFLSIFWSNRLETGHKEALTSFADQCLKSLEESLGATSEEIAGIPLQCLLIGEAYEDDAKRYLNNILSKTGIISQEISTIADLYKKLIEKKLERFQSRYNFNKLSKSEIFSAHFYMAVQTLYPLHVHKFLDILAHNMSMQEIFDFGLVEAKSVLSAWQFLHRTFAEYFVALFISKMIGKSPKNDLVEFLYNDIMTTKKSKFKITESLYFVTSLFQNNVTCYFLNTFAEKAEFKLTNNTFSVEFERLYFIAEACIYQNLEKLFLIFVLANKAEQNIINENLLSKAVYWADVNFLRVIITAYTLLNSVTPILEINCYRMDEECDYRNESDDGKSSSSTDINYAKSDDFGITLLHVAMRKADYAKVDFLINNYFRVSVKDNPNSTYNNLIHWLLLNSVNNRDWVVAEQRLIINFVATLNKELLFLEDENDRFPFEVKNPHLDLILEVCKLAKTFYSQTNILIKLLQRLSDSRSCQNFYKFIVTLFSSLEKVTIENVISSGNLLKNIFNLRELNVDILNFLMGKCSGFCYDNSLEKNNIFDSASLGHPNESVLHWLLNNLAYTNKDIQTVLTDCLHSYLHHNGINALFVFLKKQRAPENLLNFCEMFEFLFSHKKLASSKDSFTTVHLIGFFLWKNSITNFEKMDFDVTLDFLIQTGLAHIERLGLKSLLIASDVSFLKLVWITYVCSHLKMNSFLSRFRIHTKNLEINASDSCGNTLLHIFAKNFDHNGERRIHQSFLYKLQLSQSFRDRFGIKGDCVTYQDIWEVLVQNNLNILQFNNQQQTPLCLRSEFDCDKIVLAAMDMLIQNIWNFERIHQMFYLIIKRCNVYHVRKIYKWYAEVCNNFNVTVANVTTTFGGEKCNFLDAAIRGVDADVLEFVIEVLQIQIPILSPPTTSIHQCIEHDFLGSNAEKYIEIIVKIFPEEINRLVNQPNEHNIVPLSLSSSLNSGMVKLLISLGADVNAVDDNGNTPLHFALMYVNDYSYGDPVLVQELIEYGADVNAQNSKMESPLLILVDNANWGLKWIEGYVKDSIKCFEMLIIKNADPCTQDADGNTPVHHLAQKMVSGKDFHRIVEILILNKCGNVLTMSNFKGLTSLQIADKYIHIFKYTRQLLKEHGILDLEV